MRMGKNIGTYEILSIDVNEEVEKLLEHTY
jgi:hypothetical protein